MRHPAPIVDNANHPLAARLDFDANRLRARVQRVLEQLLHHRRRPLNNFARRNAVSNCLRQDANSAHDLVALAATAAFSLGGWGFSPSVSASMCRALAPEESMWNFSGAASSK